MQTSKRDPQRCDAEKRGASRQCLSHFAQASRLKSSTAPLQLAPALLSVEIKSEHIVGVIICLDIRRQPRSLVPVRGFGSAKVLQKCRGVVAASSALQKRPVVREALARHSAIHQLEV